jgi:molecular chaperone GrpE
MAPDETDRSAGAGPPTAGVPFGADPDATGAGVGAAPGGSEPAAEAGVEDVDAAAAVAAAEAGSDAGLAAERDEWRDTALRVKADFDNFRKRTEREQAATVDRAAEKLVSELLPVLDACEAAMGHGSTDVEPIFKSLLDVLEKGGLVRMDPEGQPFDPNLHDAVLHEPGDDEEHTVLESLRTGYLWRNRVVRPAMVKVRG